MKHICYLNIYDAFLCVYSVTKNAIFIKQLSVLNIKGQFYAFNLYSRNRPILLSIERKIPYFQIHGGNVRTRPGYQRHTACTAATYRELTRGGDVSEHIPQRTCMGG